MAKRNPLHQSPSEPSRLVSDRSHQAMPLLPFEKQLIEILGCSEEEYRKFAAEAAWRGRTRPAEYAHIPDIVNVSATTIAIVSLVVGVASSAASYFLAPKPKIPSFRKSKDTRPGQTQTLDSITGTDRFSPTTGFDSRAELANYGDPIPIIFGRRTGNTGGILISPKLVWSRMFSYGTEQAAKLLFVVGEQGYAFGGSYDGILPPDLEGIFIGNGVLDAAYASTFAFYWKRNTTASGFSRIKAANLLYGTRGTGASGDPEKQDDVFSCPTRAGLIDTGFSSAHSLTNSTQFGCYGPIANGSAYRVNWRIVPFPREDDGSVIDYGNTQLLERVKITGDGNGSVSANDIRSGGMFGTGRNYSPRMGITAHNNTTVPDSEGRREVSVSIGDVIKFTISPDQIPSDFYAAGNVKVGDINSVINEERIAADNALQVGEIFMIARTVWQVTLRQIPVWRPEDNRAQVVELKCIDIVGSNRIGIVANAVLARNYLTDYETAPYFIGPSFYPLLRCSFAVVRNNRACDVTEIGLRSQVYQRLNGLCSFQTLPSPAELYASEVNKISLQSGTNTSYIRRASAFTVFVRPAGVDASGNPYSWTDFNIRFVVVGNEARDQFNYIRFAHPDTRQYEYKFIPKNGADMRNSSGSTDFWLLNAAASGGSELMQDVNTIYGRFTVSAPATKTFKTSIQQNVEFLNGPTPGSPGFTLRTLPSVIRLVRFFPEEEANRSYPSSINYLGVVAVPSSVSEGKMAAFAWEIFGSAVTSSVPSGGTTTAVAVEISGSRSITIRYTARKDFRIGHYSGESYTWTIVGFEVVSATGDWVLNEQFIAARNTSSSNPFRNAPGGPISSAGVLLSISGLRTIAEVQGRAQGLYEEFFGPARNVPVGTVGTYTATYVKPEGTLVVEFRSTSYSNFLHWSGANYLWNEPTITVNTELTNGTWFLDEVFSIFETTASTNPFREPGSVIVAAYQIKALTTVDLPPGLINSDRQFEGQSQYADLSFYRNLVEKSNIDSPEHSISYVNEMVANQFVPTYDNLTIAGLTLKASRNFSSLDQIRFWLSNGCPVKRFHPDEYNTIGPSNLFCDLVFHLLTDQVAGAGRVLNMTPDDPNLINTDDLITTAKFLRENRLFFDGAITSPINLREYISEVAPYYLCNFVISNGKFSLVPALPTTKSGAISTQPVTISALFTAGNILEDSFELEYLPAEERKDFQAVVRYRQSLRNQFPDEKTVTIRWADSGTDYVPIESFDLTGYCTSDYHAFLIGKFFLSIRRRVTHSIKFRTTPYGIDLAPGNFIKVITEASPYSSARNGTIGADGTITSVSEITNGTYQIVYYKADLGDVTEGSMTVSEGKVTQSDLWNSVFTIKEIVSSENVYMVEQLTINEEGVVEIVASDFPCDADLVSVMAKDVLTDSLFVFET